MTDTEQPEQWAVDIAASLGLYSDVSVRTIVRAFANRHGDLVAAKLAFTEREAELVELLTGSTERLESVLSAMDRYNETHGTAIGGPSLFGAGTQIAANRAALKSREAGHG